MIKIERIFSNGVPILQATCTSCSRAHVGDAETTKHIIFTQHPSAEEKTKLEEDLNTIFFVDLQAKIRDTDLGNLQLYRKLMLNRRVFR